MKILLVNEKGCFDPGIIALAKALSGNHRVCIVAPLNPLEGTGHRFTTSAQPLRVKQYFVLKRVKIYSVNGTPCDCVTLALDKILKSKPDLIVSGIDCFNNRGETIHSSGVVSAAIEGTIQGFKSIAVSTKIPDATSEKDFMPIANAFAKRLNYLVKNMSPNTTLNVNYPQKFSSKNIKCTHLTYGMINNKYHPEVNPFGTQFYWLKTPVMGFALEALDQKGDLYWLKKNFITVTPLKLDLTNYEAIALVEKAGIKL